MFSNKRNLFLLLIALLILSGYSCNFLKSDNPNKASDNENGYYSIRGFLDDQWNLLHGQPIVLKQVADFNGHKDSAFVKLDSNLWNQIRQQFDPSDIGDTQFVGQYKFSTYADPKLNLVYYDYEANSTDLFTQKLNISADNVTNKIQSIFIETKKGNQTYTKTQKLTYIPSNSIQIQSYEKSIISRPENLTVTYYFDY